MILLGHNLITSTGGGGDGDGIGLSGADVGDKGTKVDRKIVDGEGKG